MRVYLVVVIFLNCLVDLLLLLGTNRLSGFPTVWTRTVSAAVLGGFYAGACLLPGFSFLGNTLWRLVFLGLMGAAAFGCDRTALKRCGIFLLLSMALGGVAVNLSEGDAIGLLAAAVLVWLLCRIGFGGSVAGREYVPLEIRNGGKVLRLIALRDSGNALRDPVTGEQVLVIDAAAAEELTGLTPAQLAAPLKTIGAVPGLRLIPYRTVDRSGGLLLAMRFRDVTVGKWKGPAVIAFAARSIGSGEGCRALTGGAMG